MDPLGLVHLTPLMQVTSGRPEIKLALIDGPVVISHPDLVSDHIQEIPGSLRGSCARASSTACIHGTFVAGILSGRRGSSAPALCPNCTLLVRPIFVETTSRNGLMPSAKPADVAAAMIDCIDAGAHIINLSVALAQPSSHGEREFGSALDYAARRGVIVVAAAGNQGTLGSSAITRHPWVIPVASCDLHGRPTAYSNLGGSIGKRGLSAPGESITSLGTAGKPHTLSGTSMAAPFVTGAMALLWSASPTATAAEVKLAAVPTHTVHRTTVVPPLLNAWAAYQTLRYRQ
ncbi:MAG TPA: S8 family serine peptidase [Anaerolineae bacterium]|nr:S8 family serine peptidase [Anaerolineae bacterium]